MTKTNDLNPVHYLPSLSLDNRVLLFELFERMALPSRPLERIQVGELPGWLVRDSVVAAKLLGSKLLVKGRAQSSLYHVGGFSAKTDGARQTARRHVVFALDAAVHAAAFPDFLTQKIHGLVRSRDNNGLIQAVGSLVLRDLVGLCLDTASENKLVESMHFLRYCAENKETNRDQLEAHMELLAELAQFLSTADSNAAPFASTLLHFGWKPTEVVQQILGLLLAGWETLPASIASSDAMLMHEPHGVADVRRVLTSYPPTWLVVRKASARLDELPISRDELVIISPWLLVRRGDLAPEGAERSVAHETLLFGAGQYRCPAFSYAPNTTHRLLASPEWQFRSEGELIFGLLGDRASVVRRSS